MKPILLEALAQVLALLPLAWELHNDRNGEDLEDKHNDVFIRGIIALIAGYLIMLLVTHRFPGGLFAGAALAVGYHFLLFDYFIAALLHARGVIKYDRIWTGSSWREVRYGPFDVLGGWFNYLGEKGTIDNVNAWRGMNPWIRLLIRLIVFEITLILYVFIR